MYILFVTFRYLIFVLLISVFPPILSSFQWILSLLKRCF